MIVLWIVAVKAVGTHLIDEPAVDPLVEMRRLDIQPPEPEKRRQQENRPLDQQGGQKEILDGTNRWATLHPTKEPRRHG